MNIHDDGEVTRLRVHLPDARDATIFGALDDAIHENARRRFGKPAKSDGEATYYSDGTTTPGEAHVDARPGRAAGGWWHFVARLVQDGQERAHLERRMRASDE